MSRLPPPLPVVLELAPLPRSQVGPFLILGVEKDADRETVEASWARRLIWARKSLTKTPLEDINWAREIMNEPDRRVRADATSLNVDTTDGVLSRLRERFHGKERLSQGSGPIDIEKNLAEYEPPTCLPDMEEIRQVITPPQIPQEIPAVRVILEEFVRQPVDAWNMSLDREDS